ncbi:tRNA dimethylallyltransferase [Sphaceloma murrayae]|uniref:tRNA dimethylallyltransferase n=1 Tax=Sphaceloma murrayae TaxID=2082308 RepID=A0A2K1QP77_9PEZI|nr:tRNA dimethylallyltransferase [Sphaceloma murrayae]
MCLMVFMDGSLHSSFEEYCNLGFESGPSGQPIIAIIGPKSTGKSHLALSIAEAFSGEIISIDSLKVYHDAPSLTNRPSSASKPSRTRTHLISYLSSTDEPRTFTNDVLSTISSIHRRQRLPILVGGSTTLTTPILFHPTIQALKPLVLLLHSHSTVLRTRLSSRIDASLPSLLSEIQHLYTTERHAHTSPNTTSGIWKAIGYAQLRPWAKALHRSAHKQSQRKVDALRDRGVQEMKDALVEYADRQTTWLWMELVPALHMAGTEFATFLVGEGRRGDGDGDGMEKVALGMVGEWVGRRRRVDEGMEGVVGGEERVRQFLAEYGF